ncbi:hypothetical protein [Aureispira sp. CCB-E]|uniref:hypothetical protein n=1 Tax=Aureispira sp. CCB-E TaxID=3051121 RepID=UPI002868655B|nr:hypothetical protein [Aureispira sp. CCB-E]WMX16134.1 hypothetical protein QP953_07120 [Aureispira sp. CCB-E]
MTTEENINKIWALIQSSNFEKKTYWELRFYESIPSSLQSKSYIDHILETVKNLPNYTYFYFGQLVNWQKNYPTLFEKILILTNERIKVENIKIVFLSSIFRVHYTSLGKNLSTIKEAYLNQIRFQNSFESSGEGLINIIKQDNSFLLDFTKTVYQEDLNFPHKLSGIWEISTIEKQLEPVFDFIISKTTWYNKTNLNNFFVNIDLKYLKRADAFILKYISNDLTNTKKISLMLDIARNQRKQLVDKILITFVSSYPSLSLFKEIRWQSSTTISSGNTFFGDIHASFWQKILSVIENADLGYKTLEIKQYLRKKIKEYLDKADKERRDKFIFGD